MYMGRLTVCPSFIKGLHVMGQGGPAVLCFCSPISLLHMHRVVPVPLLGARPLADTCVLQRKLGGIPGLAEVLWRW